MSDIKYSEKLGLNYKIKFTQNNERRIVFQDGVNYTDAEMSKLKNASERNLKNVHNIKKIFEGVIV